MNYFWQNPALLPNRRGSEADEHAARDLSLYIDSDRRFSPVSPEGQGRAVALNLVKKIASGRYDHARAPQAWSYVVESAAKAYARELPEGGPWNQRFTAATRRLVAQEMADDFLRNVRDGEYSHLLGQLSR